MKRLFVMVLLAVSLTAPRSSAAVGGTYAWTVDGPPFGPNVSVSADGYRLTIHGAGVYSDGTAIGGGSFVLTDPAGIPVTAGPWFTVGPGTLTDQGQELPVEQGRAGILVLDHVDIAGLGEASMTLYCAAQPGNVEGVSVRTASRTFDTIEVGSTTLITQP